MKVVILAGGQGTRLSEETASRPKPMVEIGGRPILWHIMKIYAAFGFQDFVICCGHKGYVIKEYFANYALHASDVTFDFVTGEVEVHNRSTEPWRVTLIDTGEHTQTGGRLRRVAHQLAGEAEFFVTYGDAVADIDLLALLATHRAAGRLATVTAVQPEGRFGTLQLDGDAARGFVEKPRGDGTWINGGFFVLSPAALSLVEDDATVWEQEPLRTLAASGELGAYRHHGFWQPMDTLRDRNRLEDLWASGCPPWVRPHPVAALATADTAGIGTPDGSRSWAEGATR